MLFLSTSYFNIHNPYFISTTSISSSSSDSIYFSINYHPLSFSRALTFIHFSSQSSTTSIQSTNVASFFLSTYTALIFIPFSSISSSISCKSSNNTSLFSTFCSTYPSMSSSSSSITQSVFSLLFISLFYCLSVSPFPAQAFFFPYVVLSPPPPPLPLFLFLSPTAADMSPSPPSSSLPQPSSPSLTLLPTTFSSALLPALPLSNLVPNILCIAPILLHGVICPHTSNPPLISKLLSIHNGALLWMRKFKPFFINKHGHLFLPPH